MAKILVPETGSQLSLSFDAGGGQPGTNSIPSTSARLREHVFGRVSSEFGDIFKPLSFVTIAKAIEASGKKEVYFVGRDRRAISLRQLIVEITDGPSPLALVALNLDLRGQAGELDAVSSILLHTMKMPWKMRKVLGLWNGRITATIPIGPIARIDVGTFDAPPVTHLFVLREEIAHLLPALDALDRPYQVVVSVAA